MRLLSILLTLLIGLNFFGSIKAQDNFKPIWEKYMQQPEAWEISSNSYGQVTSAGHYSKSISIASINLPNGFGVNVNFNYSSNLKIKQSSGWIGYGWSYNPGTISRHVNGGYITFSELQESRTNEFNEWVDFPPLIDDNADDGKRDIFSLTLPNGRSLEFALIESYELSQLDKITPINYAVNSVNGIWGAYKYHEFYPLDGNNFIIRGFYKDPVAVDSFTTKRTIRQKSQDGSTDLVDTEDIADYEFFMITDDDGNTYIYMRIQHLLG